MILVLLQVKRIVPFAKCYFLLSVSFPRSSLNNFFCHLKHGLGLGLPCLCVLDYFHWVGCVVFLHWLASADLS